MLAYQTEFNYNLFTNKTLEFIPWAPTTTNMTDLTLNHPTFHIPEPESFNKTVLGDLNSTLATLNGKFTASESATFQQIDNIQGDAVLTTSDSVTYVALTLGLVNCLSFIITLYLFQT